MTDNKLWQKIMPPLIISIFISLIGYASTSYVDNAIIKVMGKVNINKTRIELIYDSLTRIERSVDRVRNHMEGK